MYRGSSLKNTEWVIGIVAYTGHETKIMLNSTSARQKFSKVESEMNRQIVYIFLVQVTICLFCAIFYAIWFETRKDDNEYYLALEDITGGAGLSFVT